MAHPNNAYGRNLRLTLSGTSHGEAVSATLCGLPVGVRLPETELLRLLARRAPGTRPTSTARRERDIPTIRSGAVAETSATGERVWVTDGAPLDISIPNENARPTEYATTRRVPRPSHADYPALMRFGANVELAGGGKYSGRLTAPLCAVGAFCVAYLAGHGIYIGAHILSVGGAQDRPYARVALPVDELHAPAKAPFPVLDEEAGEAMRGEIECARLAGDSVGGVVECGVIGLTPGQLGDHPFLGMEARLAEILYAIPGVKAVAFGDGFGLSAGYGSDRNDPWLPPAPGEAFLRLGSNHAGGVLGGMSSGAPVLFTVGFKPTPSIAAAQRSVDLETGQAVELCIKGRHDPCIVPRAVPVVEAAAAVALTDMMLDGEAEV